MRDKFLKNSKKGLTLPVAIAISTVLVIVAAGLIFIALASVSTTTVTVNGRQAFMDVRSALEYAESYYSKKVTEYDKIGVDYTTPEEGEVIVSGTRVEYLVAKEKEDPVTHKAVVYYEKVSSLPNDARTYVQAKYLPSESGESPNLKLTAYSFYSDSFGNNGKMASLSVTFTVGSAGSQNRVTVISIPKSTGIPGSTDTIRLNLKQPVDLNWDICYYIWTYKDTAGAYTSRTDALKTASYVYTKSGSEYVRVNPDVTALNTSEHDNNVEMPNGIWQMPNPTDGTKGADGIMIKQSNGWYAGDYKINKNYVNFFNVIFTNKGKLLTDYYSGSTLLAKGDGIYDTQTCEMFHLWYLNADDKNIYFEFLNQEKNDGVRSYYTKYKWFDNGNSDDYAWNSSPDEWNGLEGLDDTILVYLKNPKTTVHFRMDKKETQAMLSDSVSGAKIDLIESSKDDFSGPTFLKNDGVNIECSQTKKTTDISMEYEGCGWWVANVDTNKVCDITVICDGTRYKFTNVSPHKTSSAPDATYEAWLIVKKSEDAKSSVEDSNQYDIKSEKEAHQTEQTALLSLRRRYNATSNTYYYADYDGTSYVTVHAKAYNPDQSASPKLQYMNVLEESSVGRQNLYEKIIEASMLAEGDYESAGFTKLSEVLGKAALAYNKAGDFIQKPVTYDETKTYEEAEATSKDNSALTPKQRIQKADEAYQTYIDALNAAIAALEPAKADQATLDALAQALKDAKDIEDNYKNYDAGYYATFVSSGQPYHAAKLFSDKIKNSTPINAEVESVTLALNNAISTMNTHTVDRVGLQSVIDSAKDFEDSSKYEKKYVDDLVNAVLAAENYLKKDSIVQTGDPSIEAHKKSINDAIEKVKNYPIKTEEPKPDDPKPDDPKPDEPELDWSGLEAQMNDASAKLQNNINEDCTQQSAEQLQNALDTARDVAKNASATQDEINTAASNLENAIKRFTVYKPNNINKSYNSDSANVRLWFKPSEGYNYTVKVYDNDGNEITAYYGAASGTFTHEGDLDYLDIPKSTGTTFEVSAFKQDVGDYSSGQINFTGLTNDNAIFVIEEDNGKGTVAKYDLVTLFVSENDNLQNSIGLSEIFVGGEKINTLTNDGNAEKNTHYRYVRYAFNDKNKVVSIINTTATGGSNTNGLQTQITEPGEYVARYIAGDQTTAKYGVTNVKDIRPIEETPENTGGEPDGKTQPTVAYGFDDYELVDVAFSQKSKSELQDIWKDSLDVINMSSNQICIIYDPDALGFDRYTYDGGPYIYYWTKSGNGGADYSNKVRMTKKVFNNGTLYKREAYYCICPNDTIGFILAYHRDDKGDGDKITTNGGNGNVYLNDGTGTNNYKYNIVCIPGADETEGKGNGELIYFNDDVFTGRGESTEDKSDDTTTTTTWDEDISISVPYGYTCLILDTNGDPDGKFNGNDKAPYAHIWSNNGSVKNLTSWNSLAPLLKLDIGGNQYYYKIFDNTYDNFIITNGANGDSSEKVVGDSKLPKNGSTLYRYYVVKMESGGKASVTYKSDKPAKVESTSPEVVKDLSSDYTMAYVGGGKIRIKNKSYSETYGNFKMQNSAKTRWIEDEPDEDTVNSDQNGTNLFGGKTRRASDKRAGDAKLLPYYDWYEYKIPVEPSNKYTFQITGLDTNSGKSSMKTEQIQNVYGDVWVSLYNEDTNTRAVKDASGSSVNETVFSHIELSTFDPDITQIASSLSVYFQKPKDGIYPTDGKLHQWSNPQIKKVNGTDGTITNVSLTASLTLNPLTFKSAAISKNNPFIEFYIEETVEGEASPRKHKYRTKLQGGKNILFNPLKNSGYGGWEEFTSDNDELIEACDNLLNMYYAKYIINQYDSNGEIVNQSNSNDTQTKSSYLLTFIEDHSVGNTKGNYGCFSRANPDDPWKTAGDQISNMNDSNAHNACFGTSGVVGVKEVVDAYSKLYEKMSLARSYIEIPINNATDGADYHANSNSSSRYPEYLNRGTTQKYEGVASLKDKLKQAEKVYITGNSVQAAKTSVEALDRAIANVSVSSEGSIAVVLYDAQGKVAKGHKFVVHYNERDDATNPSPQTREMTEYNPEGYPIVFISPSTGGSYDAIYNVEIYDSNTGKAIGIAKDATKPDETTPVVQKKMNKDEAWVLLDYSKNPRWRENSNTDYRVITNDRYVKGTDSDIELKMTAEPKVVGSTEYKTETFNSELKPVYKSMTVYFNYDTDIEWSTQETDADGNLKTVNQNYTIRAGAYTFTNKDTKDVKSPVYYQEYTESGTKVKRAKLNLFTIESKKYFAGINTALEPNSVSEASARYGTYTDNGFGGAANNAKTLNWITTNASSGEEDFSTAKRITVNGNVNMDMPKDSKASFTNLPSTKSYEYSTNGGINFRWSSPNPLYIRSSVGFYASEFHFAAVGKIDASQYGNATSHFYLYNYDVGKNDIIIRFYTDVTISYPDNTGVIHSFVIREGAYRIEKEDDSTSYIADLFNESYWKNLVYVHPLDMNGKEITGGAGLTAPHYGN